MENSFPKSICRAVENRKKNEAITRIQQQQQQQQSGRRLEQFQWSWSASRERQMRSTNDRERERGEPESFSFPPIGWTVCLEPTSSAERTYRESYIHRGLCVARVNAT